MVKAALKNPYAVIVLALADIGDERAVPVLAQRARARSLTRDDYVSATVALGDLGLPQALPALRDIAAGDPDDQLRRLAKAAIRKIEVLQADDPVNELLALLQKSLPWISEEWVLRQLHRNWDERVEQALNDYVVRAGMRPDYRCLRRRCCSTAMRCALIPPRRCRVRQTRSIGGWPSTRPQDRPRLRWLVARNHEQRNQMNKELLHG